MALVQRDVPMNRRSFLGVLLATATLDPERLLWVPKLISIPKPGNQFLTMKMITERSLLILRENLQFVRFVDRSYENEWGGIDHKVGATISIRKPEGPQFGDLFPYFGEEL